MNSEIKKNIIKMLEEAHKGTASASNIADMFATVRKRNEVK